MKLENLHSVYFLGVGGIGMSALARWFFHQGVVVHGYDLTPSALTQELENMGIGVTYQDDVDTLPEGFKGNAVKTDSLVIFTPAIPMDSKLLGYFTTQGFAILKRSEVLGLITSANKSIAVAGTHGKTTTSAMIAHSLKHNGDKINAFVGGIMTNYGTNLLIGDKRNWTVVEADEYDRSFLRLSPEIAIVTAMDADHLDIYGDGTEMRRSFMDFIGKINPNGQLIIKAGLIDAHEVRSDINVLTYGLAQGDILATNIRIENAQFQFDVAGVFDIKDVIMPLPGYHNVENALATIAVLKSLDLSDSEIISSLGSFLGVKRRFEYIIKQLGLVFIDDYAHHPAELEALLKSVRALYPSQKIAAIFQPHLYSRTRDFADGFAASLDLADAVYLLDIYPAREKPMAGVTSSLIFDQIKNTNKILTTKGQLLADIEDVSFEVLVTIGAGDIDRLVQPIASLLLNKKAHVDKKD